jgi:hypothetical protein
MVQAVHAPNGARVAFEEQQQQRLTAHYLLISQLNKFDPNSPPLSVLIVHDTNMKSGVLWQRAARS